MVPEYFFDNMQFLRIKEKQSHKLINYIPSHKTVSEQSRSKLIDWLSELHYKYKMFPDTLFMIASLIDQYLSVKEVPLSQLQLVGVAALYIAAKF
jgi:G2/mitotic-specific cyclin 1/2